MEPPKEATTSTSVPKKQHSQPTTTPVVEEAHEASYLGSRFPRDYLPLKNPSTK
jgi:hypothetical protein